MMLHSSRIVLSVAVWYATNTVATYYSKSLLSIPKEAQHGDLVDEISNPDKEQELWWQLVHLAICLSFAQLFISGAIGFFVMRIRAKTGRAEEDQTLQNPGLFTYFLEARERGDPAFKKIIMTAVFNGVGSTCVNFAYIHGSVSLVQVIKTLEPVTTYVLSAAMLKTKCSLLLSFSILLVVGGAALTCWTDSSFNYSSVLVALISNFMMPLRNVLMKSAGGSTSSVPSKMHHQQPTGFIMFSLIGAVGAVLIGCVAIITPFVTTAKFVADAKSMSNIIFSSTFFFAYNGASFTVLNLTEPVTHSILNVFKRYFNILSNIALFSADYTKNTAFGLLISLVGLLLFTQSKMKSDSVVPVPKMGIFVLLTATVVFITNELWTIPSD